jgi:uncharacterized membrane protein YeaQ/YmgE (transglycosylase-associated protein family)
LAVSWRGKDRSTPEPPEEAADMTVGGLISALIVGLIIGALGRLIVPGKQNVGILITMAVGIVAALLGTAIARATGVADTDGVDWIEIVFQVVLAAVGVFLVASFGPSPRRSVAELLSRTRDRNSPPSRFGPAAVVSCPRMSRPSNNGPGRCWP